MSVSKMSKGPVDSEREKEDLSSSVLCVGWLRTGTDAAAKEDSFQAASWDDCEAVRRKRGGRGYAGGVGGGGRGVGGWGGGDLFNGEDVFGHRCRLDGMWTDKLRGHPRQNVPMKGKLDLSPHFLCLPYLLISPVSVPAFCANYKREA